MIFIQSTASRLVIPGELPGMNQVIKVNRTNRYKANNLKQKADGIVAMHTRMAMRKGLVVNDLPADFLFTWYVPNRRKDKDNISSAVKFIFDGFVKAGLLKNDGWQQVGDIYHQFGIDKEMPRVEIYIGDRREILEVLLGYIEFEEF